ncbi:hypothetical protein [Marispirochaeta aestuarii]|uniref:hypothetical protein n=1 Tax=Marispirochaeta aestuarii TaxID=1963862 RepID=UPI0011789B03|nr:hypothetical protein [Marispirochaeta aestuarii]
MRKTEDGKYDLLEPEVWDWVTEPLIEKAILQLKRSASSDLDESDREELEKEKIKVDILYRENQIKKQDREAAREDKHLILRHDVALTFGSFISGIKNNFLQIGNRVGRGDTILRDRIEKEVEKAIDKTVKNAQEEARKIIKVNLDD